MSLSFDSANWEREIKQYVGRQGIRAKVVMTQEKGAFDLLTALGGPELYKRALGAFIREELLGIGGLLYEQYHDRPMEEYYPVVSNAHQADVPSATFPDEESEGKMRNRPARRQYTRTLPGMQAGIDALWEAISAPTVPVVKGEAVVQGLGSGPQIMALYLPDYMQMQGSSSTNSEYTSLFLAIEYGTGVADNVGGEQFVRHEGNTAEPDGSWWLGPQVGMGLHFLGQRGFHFLYDEHSRMPREIYAERVKSKLAEYIRAAFSEQGASVGSI